MSTYTSSTVSLNTSVANLAQLGSSEFDALAHGLCSANAASLCSELIANPPGTIAELNTVWARIDQALPGWQQHLPATSVTTLAAARSGLRPLGPALGAVAQDLAKLQRSALTATAIDTLTSLDYAVRRVDGERTSAVEARRGHEVLLVTVEGEGRLTTDHAGLAGDACTDRQQDFVDGMRQRGVEFDDQVAVRHDDPRGGSPIANAARAGGTTLAHGAVLGGDARPHTLTTSLLPGPARSTRSITEGGAR